MGAAGDRNLNRALKEEGKRRPEVPPVSFLSSASGGTCRLLTNLPVVNQTSLRRKGPADGCAIDRLTAAQSCLYLSGRTFNL